MSSGGASVSAGGLLLAARNLRAALRAVGSTRRVLAPVLVVALGLGLTIGPRLAAYHGNPTGFVQFGRQFAHDTHPPAGAIVGSPIGYDGQFIWIHARDPLALHVSTRANLDAAGRGYDLQRVAYPALAALLAAGRTDVLPWTLLSVNVLALLAITAAVAAYARTRGRSVWWGLAIGLTPGLVMGTLRDLGDPLAITAMLGGLIAYERGRRWPAAMLLTLAVLAREPMIVAVAAVAVEMLAGLWSARSASETRRRVTRAWPVVVVPMIIFIGWQLYTRSLTLPAVPSSPVTHARAVAATRAPAGSDSLVLPPLSDFRTEIRRTMTIDTPSAAAWDLTYIALVLAGMVAAVAALRRGPWASTVTGVLTAAVLTVIFFGDQWGISRYGAPLFGALLLSGLRAGLRASPRLCAAAAALTLLIPFVVPGG